MLVKLALLGFGVVVAGIVGMAGVFAYYARDLPGLEKIVRREGFATKIYDRKGKLLYDVFGDQRRNPVDISQVSLVVKQATVTIEDKNFYKHSGFDPLGNFEGGFQNSIYGQAAGGSTLTQQLVKNVLLTSRRTITRKLKEFILTVQVEQIFQRSDSANVFGMRLHMEEMLGE